MAPSPMMVGGLDDTCGTNKSNIFPGSEKLSPSSDSMDQRTTFLPMYLTHQRAHLQDLSQRQKRATSETSPEGNVVAMWSAKYFPNLGPNHINGHTSGRHFSPRCWTTALFSSSDGPCRPLCDCSASAGRIKRPESARAFREITLDCGRLCRSPRSE